MLTTFPTAARAAEEPLTIVVMDPLAAPLACACVKGYAQRDYDKLAEFLQQRLGRTVKVAYAEDLAGALRRETGGRADLIVGKRSVVEFDAAELEMKVEPLAMLTGRDGSTTLTGLFVVPAADRAQQLGDLKGYRVIFGPAASAEKHAAALAALKDAGVDVPKEPETRGGCAEAAIDAIESDARCGTAAVISNYAMALLEGCGTIEKGELRVIGRTKPVPFVTVFASGSLGADARDKVLDALSSVRDDPALLTAMESLRGFVKIRPNSPDRCDASSPATASWAQWRGPRRDAVVPRLPERFSETAKILWAKPMTGAGLSGIVATETRVIVADRDPTDRIDVFRCLAADTGEQRWQFQYPAPGDLDYGNSPRATPVLRDGKVYVLGAFGDLHCLKLADGSVLWKMNLVHRFGPKLPIWGYCASLLLVDDKLIVNPGAKDASLAAIDAGTGRLVWRCGGSPAAYSSFIVGTFGGVRQIVGYDVVSLGGWDPQTGRRLWQLVPAEEGDFNVPTPIDVGGKLLVTTENNCTRLYEFDRQGKIVPEPVAVHEDLAPDSSTPVVVDGRVFGCWGELFCLDLRDGLKELWRAEDDAFGDYVSLIAGGGRLLITSVEGELLLVDAKADEYKLISRLRVFGPDAEVLSHPALVGRRLYIRDGTTLCCVALATE